MKTKSIAIATIAIGAALSAYAKKELDHSSFDDWKKVSNHSLSNDGKWAAFSINPQEGDGILTIHNTATGKDINIHRGSGIEFTADSRWAIANIKPLHNDTRQAKIEKKKNFDLPQDSLAIVDLKSAAVTKIPLTKGFKIGKKGGSWVAYSSCDTTVTKDMKLSDKEAGLPLVVRNLSSGESKVYPYIGNFSFSEDGTRLAAVSKPADKDSLYTTGVRVLYLPEGKEFNIDEGMRHYGDPVFSYDGTKLAYTASNDSNETGTRRMQLWMSSLSNYPTTP
ncbi:MAG: hypothetical protein K2H49_07750, partial [Muribaculaceae bacterium]|nr:hypothetical protein [Muribaculaceae bacterium]